MSTPGQLRRLFLAAGCSVLPLLLVGATSASAGVKAHTDSVLAKSINLVKADLPTGIIWLKASPSPQSASGLLAGRAVLGCIKAAGGVDAKISSDPFGTYGKAGGMVTTDLSSPTFWPKNSTNQIPQMSSEVVFLKSASEVSTDQKAFETHGALACYGKELAQLVSSAASKATPSSTFGSRPAFGSGDRGTHVHFAITGGQLTSTFYDDAFFYGQGRAEILINFVNLGLPYSAASENYVVDKVMTRAQSALS